MGGGGGGGSVPSRLLADHLDIKKILADESRISCDSLFVDDIFDSGKTLVKIISRVDIHQNYSMSRYLLDVTKSTLTITL